MERQEKIAAALRELVAGIYNDCVGAYGAGDGNPYAGEFKDEIQAVATAIAGDVIGGPPDAARLQAAVDEWNAAHDKGTPVVVTKDDGSEVKTRTRSAAQVFGDHSAVIWIEGIAGCYALDRVRFDDEILIR